MKIILHANTDWYLYNFRMSLITRLSDSGNDVYLLTPPGHYSAKLRKMGYKWIPLPLNRRSLNPLSELGSILRIYRIYSDIEPDIVHHFTIKCVVYGSIAAMLAKIRCRVNAITGMGYVFTGTNPFIALLRFLVGSLLFFVLKGTSTCLILQNTDDARTIQRLLLGKSLKKLIIRGSGVDLNRFCPANRYPSSHDTFKVLLATRLLVDKGIHEFVEAARCLQDKPYLSFYIAGTIDDGNPTSVSASQIENWKRYSNIHYLGHVSNMPELLKQMDVVVLPSYREGTPKILLEAAATALPIIATDVPGCREVVIDGVNGILIKPRNHSAIADALLFLYRNQDLADQMGKNGRKLVEKYFSDQKIVDATIAVYHHLLNQKA